MIPLPPDDADREAMEVAFSVTYESEPGTPPLNVYKVRAGVDAVLRVLSERGRLRDGTVFDEVNAAIRRTTAFHQEAIAALTRERDAIIAQLAECFRMSGADPDGDEDWRLAGSAVQAVGQLREDYDAACTTECAAIARAEKAERELADRVANHPNERDRINYAQWLSATAEAARLRSLLHRARDAWHYEATSGDGIMEEHAALYAEVCSAIAPAAEITAEKPEGR